MKLFMAIAWTLTAAWNWYDVMQWAALAREYGPANVHRPRTLLPAAWFMTAIAAYLWWLAWRAAERE